RALAAAPQVVPLLKERVQPVTVPADRTRLARLVADLDSSKFAVRQEAAAALEKLGELAEPALVKALRGQLSVEARRRVGQILETIGRQRGPVPSPERLRALRAVELLERIATPEAQRLLAALAGGTPDAWLTREAQRALERLEKRPATTR